MTGKTMPVNVLTKLRTTFVFREDMDEYFEVLLYGEALYFR